MRQEPYWLVRIALLSACAAGCSSAETPSSAVPADADAPAPGCSFVFSGNTPETGVQASCAALDVSNADDSDGGADADADGGSDAEAGAPRTRFLSVSFASATIPSFHAAITLGPNPSAGSFSSETVSDWDITLTNAAGCAFSAGSAAVPIGSFTLELASLTSAADAGTPTGQLDATLYLHASSGMDCGPGDNEDVAIRF